jgi:hypothetical protein
MLLVLKQMKRSRADTYGVDKICPNMFMDSSSMKLEPNTFIAHEISQLKILLNRNFTHERFMDSNSWILKFLPNTTVFGSHMRSLKSNPVLSIINKGFYLAQYLYMKKRKTIEKIAEDKAYFHPKDKKAYVLGLYKRKVSSYTKYLNYNLENGHKNAFYQPIFDTPGY